MKNAKNADKNIGGHSSPPRRIHFGDKPRRSKYRRYEELRHAHKTHCQIAPETVRQVVESHRHVVRSLIAANTSQLSLAGVLLRSMPEKNPAALAGVGAEDN